MVAIRRNTAYVSVWCGIYYIYHYASMIATYLANSRAVSIAVELELPRPDEVMRCVASAGLQHLPPTDIAVLGYTDALCSLIPGDSWEGTGAFRWRRSKVGGRRLTVIGCLYSYWGDIAGAVVQVLAERGVRSVYYVGKVGTLRPSLCPNEVLATGSVSWVGGQLVEWVNHFHGIDHPALIAGRHITVASVVDETKEWLDEVRSGFDYVDPEIGPMALSAHGCAIDFSYLHLVSDNLSVRYRHDLSNEREHEVRLRRRRLLGELSMCFLARVLRG